MNEIAIPDAPHPLLALGERLSRVPRRQAAAAAVLATLAVGGGGAALTAAHPSFGHGAVANVRSAMLAPRFWHGHGFAFGHRFGPGGPYGFDHSFDAAAKTIGLDPGQLRHELFGKSLSDVATAHHVDPSKVADAMKADAAVRVDQAVRIGRLRADLADRAKQEANARIDQLMTQRFGPPRPGRPAGPPVGPPR
jgi:hypothetical protein